MDLSNELCDGDAEGGEAVQEGGTNLELCDLTIEVPRHSALPRFFLRCILGSTRLRRWYPLDRRHSARPSYFDDRSALLRATAPWLSAWQGLAYLRGRITAAVPRV